MGFKFYAQIRSERVILIFGSHWEYFTLSPKKNTLTISANNKATSNNNKIIPPVSRAQSARAARSHHEIQREITELRDRLESVEQKRNNDIDRLENQLIESNKKIENMLQQLLTQQKSKPIKK